MVPTPDTIILLLARGSVFILVITCAVHITRRLQRVKSTQLMLLALGYWISVIYYIASVLRTIGLVVPYALGITLVQSSSLLMYWFLRKTFYIHHTKLFTAVVAAAITIAVLLVSIGFIRDSTPVDTVEYDRVRWWHTVFNTTQFWLGGVTQSVISLREYHTQIRQHANRSIPPHVIKRYLYFGLSAIIMIFQASSDLIWTHLDLTTGSGATIAGFINNMSTLAFSITIYFTWVTPAWLVRHLDKDFSTSPAIPGINQPPLEGILPGARESMDKILTSRELMAIIDFLGDILSKHIGKSPAAAKGLLLLSVEAEKRTSNAPFLSFSQLKEVIMNSLKMRLEQVGIANSAELVRIMAMELVKNQSLLVMLSI